MRIGIFSGAVATGTIDELVADAERARAEGFASYWLAQIFSHDALTALALIGRAVPDIELGTAVVPTYPRHPMMLAQQALTVQAATGGRLALGIGLSHQIVVEQLWGMSYAKPVRHLREYLGVLMPMLEGQAVSFDGEEYRVHAAASVPGGSRPSVVVAALGPQMLRLCGTHTDGTFTWCVGPQTLRSFTVPTLQDAAAAAGRPAPRVIAGLPICVTDDADAAREQAGKVFAVYGQLPSYRAMMDREGVSDMSGLAVVGSEAEVRDQLLEIADTGVTDLSASLYGRPEDIERTRSLLRSML